MSFDAFGLRRNNSWSDMSSLQLLTFSHSNSTRGYTGHEQLDEVGLIHMNGRVYDPLIGRFLSADPFVQSPRDTQSYNRYSYVFNNPLSYTDPSGYFGLGDLIGAIAAVIGTIICGPECGRLGFSIIASVSFEISGRVRIDPLLFGGRVIGVKRKVQP